MSYNNIILGIKEETEDDEADGTPDFSSSGYEYTQQDLCDHWIPHIKPEPEGDPEETTEAVINLRDPLKPEPEDDEEETRGKDSDLEVQCKEEMKKEPEPEIKIEIHENDVDTTLLSTGETRISSSLCSFSCAGRRDQLNEHAVRSSRFGRKSAYKCPYSMRTLDRLKPPSGVHSRTRDKPFACDKCDKVYSHWGALAYHIRVAHDFADICDVCGKTFTNADGLIRHQSIHTATDITHCERCGKQFKDRSSYTSHLKSHSKTDPYCNICNKYFSLRGLYNGHMIKCHGLYKCQLCCTRFGEPRDLTQQAGASQKIVTCKVCWENICDSR